MPQQYGYMASGVPSAHNFECLVCGANPTWWTWSDKHGEAMCTKCGTPYQLLQYGGEGEKRELLNVPPRINIKEDWIPILQKYYQEAGAFMGLGTIMLARDYSECIEGREAFYTWVDQHPELVPAEE